MSTAPTHQGAAPDTAGRPGIAAATQVTPAEVDELPDDLATHRAWVQQIMGMPISVHVRGAEARSLAAHDAVQRLFADLRAAEAVFSTYRDESQISRLQRGELELADCDPEVRDVHRLCQVALERTDGYFDAWHSVPGHPGRFDPTGLVKTWALARAARRLDVVPSLATAVGAGGDIIVQQGIGTDDEPWQIGIQDPHDSMAAIATVPVLDGGIATSGSSARGAHIIDPMTGEPAVEVLSATVVGPSLLWADVWATTAVARGASAVDWVRTLPGTSGLLILADGSTHTWSNAV